MDLNSMRNMQLNDLITNSAGDVILRVPGGWIYTVFRNPVFVADPNCGAITVNGPAVDDLDFERIERIIES